MHSSYTLHRLNVHLFCRLLILERAASEKGFEWSPREDILPAKLVAPARDLASAVHADGVLHTTMTTEVNVSTPLAVVVDGVEVWVELSGSPRGAALRCSPHLPRASHSLNASAAR
jgi:hypothetical protein